MSENNDRLICLKCYKVFPEGTKNCPFDGNKVVSLEKMTPRCVKCGKAYTDGTRFCPKDGGQVVSGVSENAPQNVKTYNTQHNVPNVPREKYDLRTLKYDKLRFLMNAAKGELARYTLCCENVANCQNSIATTKQQIALYSTPVWVLFVAIILIPAFGIGLILLIAYFSNKSKAEKAEASLRELESQLSVLNQELQRAINNFKAVLFIPNDYCYDHALTAMIKYIDNKMADSWKECVSLYEEQMHRMTMEETSKQTLEQAKQQTQIAGATLVNTQQLIKQSKEQIRLAKETRDATRDIEAHTWAIREGLFPSKNSSIFG